MVSTITDRLYGESSGVAVKAPVVAVTNGTELSLVGLTPVGTYAPQEGDRILVKDQTNPTANGIYNASVSGWQRTGDFDGSYDCVEGTLVIALLNNGQALIFQLVTPSPVIGTTPLVFMPFWQPPNVTYPQTPAEALAGVSPVNEYILPGNITRYGAVSGTSVSTGQQGSNATAIQAAINQAIQSGGSSVFIPSGTWLYSAALTVPMPCQILGEDMYTAVLEKHGNFVGLSLVDGGGTNYSQATLRGFTLLSAGGDSADGLLINTVGRVRVSQLIVQGHGSHGIEIIQGTVCRYDDISTISNGGDGIKLTGSGGVQANANTFTNIDTRGNAGAGMRFESAMANMGTGIVSQSNGAGGVIFDTCFGNRLDVYCELNAGGSSSIIFTANCIAANNFGGNMIYAAYLDVPPSFQGASAAVNVVYTNRSASVLQPAISQLIADAVTFSNTRTDGNTPQGIFSVSHATNLELDVVASGFSGSQKTKFSNSAGGGALHGVQADNLLAVAAAANWGTGVLSIGNTTAAGATSGSASGLPATPAAYLNVQLGATAYKIPLYNA